MALFLCVSVFVKSFLLFFMWLDVTLLRQDGVWKQPNYITAEFGKGCEEILLRYQMFSAPVSLVVEIVEPAASCHTFQFPVNIFNAYFSILYSCIP